MLPKKSSRLALEPLPQRVVEVGELALHGHDGVEVAQIQPLPREVLDERRRRARRPACAAPAARALAGRAARRARRRASSSSSGMLLQRKNDSRDASVEVRHRVNGARRGVGRVLLDAEQELRRHEQAFQRELNAGVEAGLRAVAIEREQRRDVVIGHGAPVRAARELGQDLARAAPRPAPRRCSLGLAREDSLAGSPCRRRRWLHTAR